MAGSCVIPEVYFPDVDDQELHTSDVEGEGGPGGGSAEGQTEDLTKEGFIPIYKLTLDDLPEEIRTEENLQHILDMATTVVVVNNNRLSDKRRDDEQMKKSGKSLKGSGRLAMEIEENNFVFILTNRHVLFNYEEIERSTFDVFYDYSHGNSEDKEKLFKRCRRGDGTFSFTMCSGLDVTEANYDVKDEMMSHIRKHCRQNPEKAGQYRTQLPIPNHGASIVPTVCLISHPLGRTKHVSFGHLVDVDYNTRTFHHTAPSKSGSSGAPVMVFTRKEAIIPGMECLYHVGTDLATKQKEAKFMAPLHRLCDFETSIMNISKTAPDETDFRPDQLAGSASVCLDTEYLAAFVPIFGAFLLHTDKYGLEGIDTALFKPCKTWVGAASTFSVVKKSRVRDFLQKVKQLLPGFDMGPSSTPGEDSDLASLLTPHAPCFCRSIVKLMERGVKSGDSTFTESFLSPDTAAVKMSSDSDVTWPWLSGSECDVSSLCAEEEECLIKKCLQTYKCHQAVNPPIILLLIMMRKANVSIALIPPHSCDISFTTKLDENETPPDIVNSQRVEALPREMTSEKRSGGIGTFPRSAAEEESKSPSTSSQGECVEFIGNILHLIMFVLGFFVETISGGFNNTNGELSKQEQGDQSLNSLFSRYLARREHEVQHLQQEHLDWKPSEKGDGSGGPCQCGRPFFIEVMESLRRQETSLLPVKCYTSLQLELASEIIASPRIFFLLLQKEALEKQPDNPGNFILNFLDNCGHFPQGRYSLIRFQASHETLLYNCRQLLRQVSKAVQTDYLAFPASVYGRPGNWPGNVTPPEVQRKAWRLIQDAIMESGFPPAVLVDLEEDAERRQRLIDVYVDMKQLKWQGRIQPHLFRKAVPKTRRNFVGLSGEWSFPDTTCYFAWSVSALICPKVTFR